MKKIIIFAFIIIISISTNKLLADYPSGSAAGFFIRFSFPSQASLGFTGKFEGIPFMFGGFFNIGIASQGWAWFGLSVSADWWGFTTKLGNLGKSDIRLYLGPGLEAITEFGKKYWNIGIAFRMPVGVSFIVDRDWEIFLQITPGLSLISIGSRGFGTFGWYPSYTGWTFASFFRFSGDFGFRYWF